MNYDNIRQYFYTAENTLILIVDSFVDLWYTQTPKIHKLRSGVQRGQGVRYAEICSGVKPSVRSWSRLACAFSSAPFVRSAGLVDCTLDCRLTVLSSIPRGWRVPSGYARLLVPSGLIHLASLNPFAHQSQRNKTDCLEEIVNGNTNTFNQV